MASFFHNDIKYCYEDLGKGVPIIFIHPPAMGRKTFYFQRQLSEHFRTIFLDLSGNGDTVGRNKNVCILEYAKEVKALLNHLNIEKAVIFGYSAGGLIAQEFALSFPERTKALILAGGYPEVKSILFKYEHILGMYFVKKCPTMLAWLISKSHTENENVQTEIFHHMLKADRNVWFQLYERSLHYSCTDRLHQLNKPVLLIYGDKEITTKHIQIYKKKIKFQLAIIEWGKHQLPTRKWKQMNEIISGYVMNL